MAKTGCTRGRIEPATATPPSSRARAIVARGNAPTARHLGSIVNAALEDVLLGGLSHREVHSVNNGVRTLVVVARNSAALDDLAREIVEGGDGMDATQAPDEPCPRDLLDALAAARAEAARIEEEVAKVSKTRATRNGNGRR